jgi:hypothetical protein
MRIRDWLLWLISADKPVRLGIPSYTKDRDQYGQGTGRQNEFRIVKKKTARLTPKAHLEIFPRLKLSFHLFTALTLLACEYLLSGSAFKSSHEMVNGDASLFRKTSSRTKQRAKQAK